MSLLEHEHGEIPMHQMPLPLPEESEGDITETFDPKTLEGEMEDQNEEHIVESPKDSTTSPQKSEPAWMAAARREALTRERRREWKRETDYNDD